MDFQEGYPTWRPDRYPLLFFSLLLVVLYLSRMLDPVNDFFIFSKSLVVDGQIALLAQLFFTCNKELSIANEFVR